MVVRRRGLLKYLFLIPALWFATVILFSLHADPPSKSISPANNGEIKLIVANRSFSVPSFVDRLINALPFKQSNIDTDHPSEERDKAQKQAREMKGPVQVAAPELNEHQNNPKIGAPGEMGNPVRVDKGKLSPEEKERYQNGWRNHAFNEYVSDMISLRRSLADVRDQE